MKKKYAFLLMGPQYDPHRHQARFDTGDLVTIFCTVRTPQEAKAVAVALAKEGVGAMELCGAFGPALAQEIIGLTEGKVAVGYVIHNPEQDELFHRFFS